MNPYLKNYVVSFELGRGKRHENMAVFPITTQSDGGPDYLTLREALEKGVFAVTEVSEGGAVPNLKVSNKGEIAVLLLDGEELAGAKQNRVLNTTILVKEGTEVVIPVSCTEHGRWSYTSREFYESGNVMAPKMRAMSRGAVAASLESSRQFRSDQSAVWDGIERMAGEAGAQSRTGAMKDIYDSKMSDLDGHMKAFGCGPGQKGILVMIGGEVVGFDFVSCERAFAVLFPKLIKSYAMEAWLEGRKRGSVKAEKGGKNEKSGQGEKRDKDDTDHKGVESSKGDEGGESGMDITKARAFLAIAGECDEKSYDSVGLGKDVRFDGKGVVGSALVVNDKPVHVAFFSATESDKAGSMAGTSRRRRFRTG